MRIAVLNGPNLNRLGKRRPERYGTATLAELIDDLTVFGATIGVEVVHMQSNHEGDLIDWLHEQIDEGIDGLIVNPSGLSPYGRPLCDGIRDAEVPWAVVHLSQLYVSYGAHAEDYFKPYCDVYIAGLGARGYAAALVRIEEYARLGLRAN